MLESPVLHFNGKKKKSCLIEHIFKPNQIYQSTIKTHTAVSHFKFPIDHSDEYWPVITTLGSIDQSGYNRLKPLVKTGGGFDRPTLKF